MSRRLGRSIPWETLAAKKFCVSSSGASRRGGFRTISFSALLAVTAATLLPCAGVTAQAQGILTVTPGRSAATTAGVGTIGYSGDGGGANSATLANPGAVAYDTAGNLYLADTNNHVVREVVKSSGTIVTLAGTGTAGFSGDGGPATSAQLDTPTGIAVDASGALYVADSHNHRIRRITAGTIATIAGAGTAGFSGDNGAAVSAQLNLPSAVALDAAGNLYIADTNNQRVRRVSGATIGTVAGNGEQLLAGDGGPASSASLDSPTGVVVDASGVLYIADTHNHRVRTVSAAGIITTLAGNGVPTFAGGFAGDGSAATGASLSRPAGISVDAAGNVYIADANNQRVRQVTAGTIATLAGNGVQGYAADGGPVTASSLNEPRALANDPSGNLSIADTLDQRVRALSLATLAFGPTPVGVPSAPQTLTLSNTGSAAITVSSTRISGAFALASGSSCSAAPFILAAGASCTESVAFLPNAAGAAAGSATFSGAGVVSQTVLLSGTAGQATTTTTLASSVAAPLPNQSVTYLATVQSASSAVGNVTFYSGGTLLGTAALTNGTASFTTIFTNSGTFNITAVYTGNANFGGSTSPVLTQAVGDFNFALTPASSGSNSSSIVPGQAATYNLTAAPLNGPFSFPISLTATGLPPGATVVFSPASVSLGASPASFTMTVQTSRSTAALQHLKSIGGTTMAVLLLPFALRLRRRRPALKPLLLIAMSLTGLATLAGLTGCGSSSGFFGQPQQTYTINIVATATGTNGATLQHSATVQLTVQ